MSTRRLQLMVQVALVALLLLLTGQARAEFDPVTREYAPGMISPLEYFTSPGAACARGIAYRNASAPAKYSFRTGSPPFTVTNGIAGSCNMQYWHDDMGLMGNQSFSLVNRIVPPMCVQNSSLKNGKCVCDEGFTQTSGSDGPQCAPEENQCTAKAGDAGILNWTTGWTRTPNDNDNKWVGTPSYPPPGTTGCSAACEWEITDGVDAAWIAQKPHANGMYRNSVDYVARATGKKCGPQTDPEGRSNPESPEPECPGYVGDVNGTKGCYGSADKPVNPSTVTRADTPGAGNPSAGLKPETGEGSGTGSTGRTPATGDGGNAGGPAAAGEGGKGGGAGGAAGNPGKGGGGGGTGTEPPKPCGAPGQPICNVKVDETGTPTANNRSGEFETETAKLKTEQENRMTNAGSAAAQSVGDWGFGFSLPSGCGAYTISGLEITVDVCQWQGTIHDLMAMIWLMTTAWCCIGMVGRTVSGGS